MKDNRPRTFPRPLRCNSGGTKIENPTSRSSGMSLAGGRTPAASMVTAVDGFGHEKGKEVWRSAQDQYKVNGALDSRRIISADKKRTHGKSP